MPALRRERQTTERRFLVVKLFFGASQCMYFPRTTQLSGFFCDCAQVNQINFARTNSRLARNLFALEDHKFTVMLIGLFELSGSKQ